MSTNFVDAKAPSKKDKDEKEDCPITIYFGLFFDGSNDSKGIAQTLSPYYKYGKVVEGEKYYSISTTVQSKNDYRVKCEDQVVIDNEAEEELAKECANAASRVLSQINGILSGFWDYRKNATIYIDVFGVDSGCIPAIAFCNVAEPGKVKNDGSYVYECTIAECSEGGMIDDFRREGATVILNTYSFMDSSNPIEYVSGTDSSLLLQGQVVENNVFTSGGQTTGDGSTLLLSGSVTYNHFIETDNNGNTSISYEAEIKEDPQHPLLDGLQFALDMSSMVLPPGLEIIPSLINAGISAARGNWADAGLSLLGVVPIVGDAAMAAKLAKNGMKVAKAVQKTEQTGKVIKASEKFASNASSTMKNTKNADNIVDFSKVKAMKEGKVVSIEKQPKIKMKKEGTTGDYVEEYSMRNRNVDVKLDSSGEINVKNSKGDGWNKDREDFIANRSFESNHNENYFEISKGSNNTVHIGPKKIVEPPTIQELQAIQNKIEHGIPLNNRELEIIKYLKNK